MVMTTTIDIKNEIERFYEEQRRVTVSPKKGLFSAFEKVFLKLFAFFYLRRHKRDLKNLKVAILNLKNSSQADIQNLMASNRSLEKTYKRSNNFIEELNITGENWVENLLLENNRLLKECCDLLSSKLYQPKSNNLSDEEWEKYSEEIRTWAGDDWDDSSYDEYDAQFSPISHK